MKTTPEQYQNIRRWMHRNARPIDLARWQFHFEDGTKENVLEVLTAYQNTDGGFAYALEEDSWNPNSSPIQTWCAVELLREVNLDNRSTPLIQGILRYLDSECDFIDGKWMSEIQSNNDYPHAFWWDWSPETVYDYNPTANLAGFVIKYAENESMLYKKATEIAKQAAESFMSREEINDGHLLLSFARLYQYCMESNIGNLFDLKTSAEKLSMHIGNHLKNLQVDWCCDGVVYQFLKIYKNDLAADLCDDLIEFIAGQLLKNLQSDGSWNIPWNWNSYNEEWAISKNWWKGYAAVANTLFLKRHHYLP